MIPTSEPQIKIPDYIDKSNIAVIGDEDLISGLKIFDFDVFFVKDKDVRDIFREVLEKDYKICFIQEIYFSRIKDLFSEIKEKPFPLILPIPDHSQIKGLGREILKELSIKAVGADILR